MISEYSLLCTLYTYLNLSGCGVLLGRVARVATSSFCCSFLIAPTKVIISSLLSRFAASIHLSCFIKPLSFSFTENSLSPCFESDTGTPQSDRGRFPETAKSVHQKLSAYCSSALVALCASLMKLFVSLFHANHVPRIRQSVIDGRLWKRFERSTFTRDSSLSTARQRSHRTARLPRFRIPSLAYPHPPFNPAPSFHRVLYVSQSWSGTTTTRFQAGSKSENTSCGRSTGLNSRSRGPRSFTRIDSSGHLDDSQRCSTTAVENPPQFCFSHQNYVAALHCRDIETEDHGPLRTQLLPNYHSRLFFSGSLAV
jgi:hypothetical protein